MTKKHALLFYFWKLYQRLKGYKVGTIVKIYSHEKREYIKGCITYINGDSIDSSSYDFSFGVNLFRPLQGNDSRYYMFGVYYPKDFSYNHIDGIFYCKS